MSFSLKKLISEDYSNKHKKRQGWSVIYPLTLEEKQEVLENNPYLVP